MDDIDDLTKVKEHVDIWFQNLLPGEVFDPNNPTAVASFDYSLQLDFALDRLCLACSDGAMEGQTPQTCIASGAYTKKECKKLSIMSVLVSQESRANQPLPRQ